MLTTNFLSPIGFQFGIIKLPSVGFYAQRCNLPDLSLPEATQTNPFTDVPVPGEKLQWGTFSIDFIVDEKMDNYKEVWSWMIGLGFPNDYNQFISGGNLFLLSDGFLQILTANNTIAKTIKFKDMFPTSLSAITFASTENDVNYIQATADFRYTSFTIE